ncbi:MAG: cysteine desulfurase family protein [Bacilli bacterium]|nr:cysteine desulfurase family protein [Bacilli bacterium]
MIYLDYSATTPVNKAVLDSFNKVCLNYIGNPNSLHKLGVDANNLEKQATNQIKEILNLTDHEVIYTSGSSESNNLAIKGICDKYQNVGKHIITTNLEHSSIYGPVGYLQKKGYEVDFVKTNEKGIIDLDDLKNKLREDTVLVTIASVNSETGILQPINEIGQILKEYKCFFHVDATQSIGKVKIDFKNVDLFSFSAHKIYGLKGIGCLVKNKKINLEPIIHGGKSTTIYRSGTPALPLIVSLAKALRLINETIDEDYKNVLNLNNYLKQHLQKYDKVFINSNEFTIPHVLNISIIGIKPETMQHALEEDEIYISTQSACSSNNPVSKAVLEVTKDELKAKHSIRISLSGLTTKEEINKFLVSFDRCYYKLNMK